MTSRRGVFVFVLAVFLVLVASSFASAGLGEWFGRITGMVTSNPVNVNITVSDVVAPVVYSVNVIPAVNLNEGPSSTVVVVNFSASDSSDLNDSSTVINLTRSGEAVRANTTNCVRIASAGNNNVNYSCNVRFFWFDGAGDWNIAVGVKDASGNFGMNLTKTVTINALTGFVSSPAALTWAAIIPGSSDQVSINDPVLINNTGNQDISAGSVQLNTTHLKGEVDSTKALYAGNFSAGVTTGGNAECGATTMAPSVYTAIGSAALPRGNFTVNDNSTGQEQVYFCLKYAGTELTSQAYSTSNMGAWTLKIA